MVNQICIAGLVQGLPRASFRHSAGLDVERSSTSSPRARRSRGRWTTAGKTMVDGKFDFGFAVDWMRKDLGICLAEARRNGSRSAVAALVDQFYSEVQAMGGRRWDTSSLIARLERD
jgi:3-hydroxyisobutyrate dehydrogenase